MGGETSPVPICFAKVNCLMDRTLRRLPLNFVLLFPASLVIVSAADATTSADRPNVLMIAVDDLNDWCGVLGGHPQARTPNLDRLAARGVFFQRAYCAAPSCNPSRVALLTGLRPSTSGVYVNDQKFRRILPDAVTLPQYFTAHGYRVAGGGKIFHHGDTDPQSWPEYFDQPRDPTPEPLVSGPISNHFTWQPLDMPDNAMGDYKVVSWASDWLAKAASQGNERPFFLAVGFYRPHMPLHVPRKYFDAYPLDSIELPVVKEGDLDDVPTLGRWLAAHRDYHTKIVESGQWRNAVQGYLAAVEFFDAMLGRLIDALGRSPFRDNTVVVLWSDHGWHHGQKDHWSKFALWEQTTRVPMLWIVPGVTHPNGRCDTPVSLQDVYPTLLELCGLPRKQELEGVSLVPQLKNPAASRTEPAVMTFGPDNHAVRDSRWRYIRYCDGGEELYDCQTDPHEWTNLANCSDLADVKQSLAKWLPTVNRPLRTPSKWLPPQCSGLSESATRLGNTLAASPLIGIVVDDDKAAFTGDWLKSSKRPPLVGDGYRHDGNGEQGEKSARFTLTVTESGRYEVRLLYAASPNRSTRVPVTVNSAEGEATFTINQQEPPRPLGVFRFDADSPATVVVSNVGADGFVTVDAVQLVPEALARQEAGAARAAAPKAKDESPSPPLKPLPRIEPVRSSEAAEVDGRSFDLVVVGATPGGIACAVRAAREGLSVLLVHHHPHIGGFITSGAGGWEAPYDGLRSPLYGEMRTGGADFYREYYGEGSPQHRASLPDPNSNAHIDRPKIEPRIAELLFNRMLEREKNLTVLTDFVVTGAERDGVLLKTIALRQMHGKQTCRVGAKIFADGMYEADLAAAAEVPYRVGREARNEYNEPHAGVLYTEERRKEPGQRGFPKDADEGRLKIRYNSHATAEIVEGPHSGEADDSVMAYNYRLILTRDPANRILVDKPADYDVAIAKAAAGGGFVPNLPNRKVAWNGGRLVGPQNGYPEGDWTTRERISCQYLDAMLMRLWYLQNDPRAPAAERKKFAGYGLAADEFPDNNHAPYEIYVREARRIVGRRVFTEHDNKIAEGIARTPVHFDSVAITDWPVDSVACLPRRAASGHQDGILFLAEEGRPAQVPYRCLLPQGVDNLLVPVAISASHVGWGSIRLEPVWMQLGESAGFAAALAVKNRTTPARLDSDQLVRTLVKNRVMVSFFNDVDVTSDQPWTAAVQYFGAKGFFASYDAKPTEPLTEAVAQAWAEGFEQLSTGRIDSTALVRAVATAEESATAVPVTQEQFSSILSCKQAIKERRAITRGEACQFMFNLLEQRPTQ